MFERDVILYQTKYMNEQCVKIKTIFFALSILFFVNK